MGLLRDKSESEFTADEKKLVDHELAIASDIQENLMPRRIPQIPGYEVTAYYKPSQEVGGDYYDFIDIGGDRVAMVVADVSGKGVPGALVMVQTRAYLRSAAERLGSPRDLAIQLNRFLHQDIPRGMFVTMYYAVLDPKNMRLTCLSSGHNPMVLWRARGKTCHIVNPNGLALGIDRGPIFERSAKEQVVQLECGDRFVLYTDGLVEAMNKENVEYGSMRFYRNVLAHAERESSEFLSLIVKDVSEHVGDRPAHDDITVVTVRASAAAVPTAETA